ncbi:MAG TPA: ATP-binding protein, partial [Candidatus Baltobacteraceae bacterium]
MRTAPSPADQGKPWSHEESLDGLLRGALDNAADVVMVCELKKEPDQSGTIVYVNDAFTRTFGYAPEEVIGRTRAVLHGALTDRAALRAMRHRLASGEAAQVEIALYRKDGTYTWAQDHSRPLRNAANEITHYVSIARDVTDATVRHLTLSTQNESLTKLTSIARSLFVAFEPRALVQTLVVGVRELTGGRGMVYAGLPGGGYALTHDLGLPEADSPRGDEFIESAAHAEICIIDETGHRAAVAVPGSKIERIFAVSLDGIRMPSAQDVFAIALLAQYFAVAARNVELYAELESRRAAVLELSSAKSDLIAMLGHDFAGPLTSINGFAQLLLEQEYHEAETRTYIEMIAKSAQRLASLARDTLALSRLEHNEIEMTLEPVDLVALVKDVANSFVDLREVRVTGQLETLVVRADGARLRQVFENLIGNAIKYSPDGNPVCVAVRRRGDRACIAVLDSGIGIPESDRSQIFSRFLRASNARRMGIAGTGFGLYLVKRLVDRHGGQILFRSKVGRGSCFTVRLPIDVPRGGVATRARRLLLVDADGDARSFCAHSLRLASYSVRTVTDVASALTALGTESFDVVIVDVDAHPPGRIVNPADFKRASPTPLRMVVLCSPGQTTSSGWDVHLTKPFLANDLQRAVETALGT